MYIPKYYKNENLAQVKEFLSENAFGILISQTDNKPWATHIPLELDVSSEGKDILVGHISKANRQSESLYENQEVLCIFNGPHAYISSSWYQKEDVPTWDYIAVHVYGKVSIMDDESTLYSLSKLMDKYEKDEKKPVSLKNLSSKTLRQIKGIVGFQIEIRKIEAAYKLSQNRPEDHRRIVGELKSHGNQNDSSLAKEIFGLR